MSADIDRFINNCHTCKKSRMPRDKIPGFLHSSPIAVRPFDSVTIDFHSLPKDRHGYDNVFMVVDQLGKRHFSLPYRKNINTKQAATLYYRYIYRMYRAPLTITSDRGPQFMSYFINELYHLISVKIKLSTAYHPQTNGQTKIINQIINQRLRPFITHY